MKVSIKNSIIFTSMEVKKTFISFLIIFSYTLGFAHNLVPHCDEQHSAVDNGYHNEYHHHNNDESITSDHSHIAHNDHYDKDVLDLIICAFEESNHHGENCNLELYTPSFKFIQPEKSILGSSNPFDEFTYESELDLDASISNYYNNSFLTPSDELTIIIPLRGPPVHIS